MIPLLVVALIAVAAIGVLAYQNRRLEALLGDERARTRELLSLVEAQRAPAAYYAVTAPPAPEAETWAFDETGLFGTVIDDG